MYVYARLHGLDGKSEVALIQVELIQHGYVTGMILSDVTVIPQSSGSGWYAMPESDLVDWTIAHADGADEGHACSDPGLDEQDNTRLSYGDV